MVDKKIQLKVYTLIAKHCAMNCDHDHGWRWSWWWQWQKQHLTRWKGRVLSEGRSARWSPLSGSPTLWGDLTLTNHSEVISDHFLDQLLTISNHTLKPSHNFISSNLISTLIDAHLWLQLFMSPRFSTIILYFAMTWLLFDQCWMGKYGRVESKPLKSI